MAHPCCDPDRATQCRAHNVAAISRSFRGVAGLSRYTPPTLTKMTLSHQSCHPPLSVLQGNFLAKNGSRYTGVYTVAATLTPITLHCATKAINRDRRSASNLRSQPITDASIARGPAERAVFLMSDRSPFNRYRGFRVSDR